MAVRKTTVATATFFLLLGVLVLGGFLLANTIRVQFLNGKVVFAVLFDIVAGPSAALAILVVGAVIRRAWLRRVYRSQSAIMRELHADRHITNAMWDYRLAEGSSQSRRDRTYNADRSAFRAHVRSFYDVARDHALSGQESR